MSFPTELSLTISTTSERGDHLAQVSVPMLFLQGTRDKLADLDLLRPICHPQILAVPPEMVPRL